MKLKTIKKLGLFLLCIFSIQMKGQENKEKLPLWITIMEDSKVNYYEALKEFDEYWRNREKPNEEEEIFKEKKVNKLVDKETIKYAFEYKKFLEWKKKMYPYIKEDGTIASPEERRAIWEQEKKNRTSIQQN